MLLMFTIILEYNIMYSSVVCIKPLNMNKSNEYVTYRTQEKNEFTMNSQNVAVLIERKPSNILRGRREFESYPNFFSP